MIPFFLSAIDIVFFALPSPGFILYYSFLVCILDVSFFPENYVRARDLLRPIFRA